MDMTRHKRQNATVRNSPEKEMRLGVTRARVTEDRVLASEKFGYGSDAHRGLAHTKEHFVFEEGGVVGVGFSVAGGREAEAKIEVHS
jgi:hypothetical protein